MNIFKKIKCFIVFLLFGMSLMLLEKESIYNFCKLAIMQIEKEENVKEYNLYKLLNKINE